MVLRDQIKDKDRLDDCLEGFFILASGREARVTLRRIIDRLRPPPLCRVAPRAHSFGAPSN